MSEPKPGMPSPALTKDDVRRIIKEIDRTMEMIKQQDTNGDQVECTDTQAEWEKYSPTAD